MHPLDELKARLLEIDDLERAGAVLAWDQMTYMPPGGAAARGRQMGTLGRLAHEKFTDVEVGRLLDALERESPPEEDDRALVRLTRRLYDDAVRIPAAFVSEWNAHNAQTYEAWKAARAANDFSVVRPLLEKTLVLSRQKAELTPNRESIADPLIAIYDYGTKARDVRALFAELRAVLVPLVRAVTSRERPDDAFLKRPADHDAQLAFGREIARAWGYDFERGRLDLTVHPFMTKFSLDDVRITTRVRDDLLTDALFSTLHEAGHGLYAQGVDKRFEGTPLANAPSAGFDESQSRLWENLVGRSRAFWDHFHPKLQRAFPHLRGVDVDAFYRAVNRVERSLVRTEADELTYNLHVMLRFDLELDLLEGRLEVKDLPRAWAERIDADFGLEVPDGRSGVLQDVHWYSAGIGGEFQGYTLGNVMGAQIYAAAVAAEPAIPSEMARGEFGRLRRWLTENVYRHGSKLTPAELLDRATGRAITIEPYVSYLRGKYGALYGV
jgi:carboxypeptidase Taq